jgi:putative transposase
MLLQPHTGRRPIRAHEGTVIAPASNQRWASDGLEIPCWNGEVVRVAFAIDTDDREIIAWVATSGGGISGEMIMDMMLDCVERRFDAIRAPQRDCREFRVWLVMMGKKELSHASPQSAAYS